MRSAPVVLLAALLLGACASTGTGTRTIDAGLMVNILVENHGWNEARVELHTMVRGPRFLGSVSSHGSKCFRVPQPDGEARLVARTVLGGRRYIVSDPFAIHQRPGWVWSIHDGAAQGISLNHGAPCEVDR